jgi:hypothetical protein
VQHTVPSVLVDLLAAGASSAEAERGVRRLADLANETDENKAEIARVSRSRHVVQGSSAFAAPPPASETNPP